MKLTMKRNQILLPIFLTIILSLTISGSEPVHSASQEDRIRVIVEYQPGKKISVEREILQVGAEVQYEFDDLNALAVSLPTKALEGISRNPNVVSIEEDPPRYLIESSALASNQATGISPADNPLAEQVIPYGIDMVQARDVWDVNRDGSIDPGAPIGAGKTVCIIDSGLYTTHDDFVGVNVLGGYPAGWDSDGLGHGTHVAGTIAAMNNTIGVVGVTPGTVDLYIVRVFGDDGSWIYASDLADAAYRCQDAGADIISMSLAGSFPNGIERNAFNNLFSDGILSIAAASNEGSSTYAYPASYDSVVSVGAIDSSMTVASFSNYNDQVELAAPGVGVLSTVPFLETNTVTVDGVTYYGNHIENTARGSVTGDLVDGGLCGSTNPAWSGKVVLCERGSYSFAVKVLNVEDSGGAAALIYNNVSGNFLGTIDPETSSIVGLSLTQADGDYLVSNKLGLEASVVSNPPTTGSGYEAWNGTSMATPHVSGATALAWSCAPGATNSEVRNALNATALDLGTTGRDNYYGYGLVQAKDACNDLNPTAVELRDFTATGEEMSVRLDWATTSEVDNLGFNLYRSESPDGGLMRINADLIPSTAPGSLEGAVYRYVDTGSELPSGQLTPNKEYYYWLEDVDIYGSTSLHGPESARVLPLGNNGSDPDKHKFFLPLFSSN